MIQVCVQIADQRVALLEDGLINGQFNNRQKLFILVKSTRVKTVVLTSFLGSQESSEYSGLLAWLT